MRPWSIAFRHLLIKLCQNLRPSFVMTVSRLRIGEASVCKPQLRPAIAGAEFDRHDCFGPFSRGGKPRKLHQPVGFESKEAAVVRMALALELSFEIKTALISALINTVPGAANHRSQPMVQA